MASNGYPGSFEKETIINGIDKLENTDTFQVFHAATAIKDKKIDTVLSYGKMGNIIADSFYNYQENKKIKAIKGIKEKYINPIKKLINKEGTLKGVSTVWEKIEEVEKGEKRS